mmetsp:Transcript_23208/g.56984  ORF Transcript_23208/g.56984 Transcript_23208/m.56984 type:complete len:141 (+) Transcript_23208:73-495(+)|eukprot:CAMPEP_0197587726 /NCGR_PEP_ID=MMETSP1326-20131121/9248_1 /TAXON_ID=1155430 /ORGANISM="Genus nov. species nov., Strain RCC2288" /LENGTH=140 /DNA_ID=CAMNT_0043152483 /DNA_START=76 /DNA_END=498 /DNA_ORIENTATION=+
MEKLKANIQQVEVAGDHLKVARAMAVELDIRRQGNRECLVALRKQEKAAAEPVRGVEPPPANAWVFRPGQVIVRMPRGEAKALVETDQEAVEVEIRDNERAVKRALKDLDDKGAIPGSVGSGLLNAFVNLEDNKGKNKGS